MNTRPLIIVLAVVVLLIIGYLVYDSMNDADAPSQTATTTQSAVPSTPPPSEAPTNSGSTPGAVTITYGANGFSPATITVPVGTRVTWVNQTSERMWIGSASHPTHTGYDGTSLSEHCANDAPVSAIVFDQCRAGSTFSFTFTKAGTWPYHNHADSSDRGTVIVTP